MQKTIVGLFSTQCDAQEVICDLIDAGFDQDQVSFVSPDETGEVLSAIRPCPPGNDRNKSSAGEIRAEFDPGAEFDAAEAEEAEEAESDADAGANIQINAQLQPQPGDSLSLIGESTSASAGGLGTLLARVAGLTVPGIGPVLASGPIAGKLIGAGVDGKTRGLVTGLANLGVHESDVDFFAESVHRGNTLVALQCQDRFAVRAAEIMRRHGAIDIDRRRKGYESMGWRRFNEKSSPYSHDQMAAERQRYRSR